MRNDRGRELNRMSTKDRRLVLGLMHAKVGLKPARAKEIARDLAGGKIDLSTRQDNSMDPTPAWFMTRFKESMR